MAKMLNCCGGGCFPGGRNDNLPSIDWSDPLIKASIESIRSSMPNLTAYDICSVQPMLGPTSLVFGLGKLPARSYKERILRNIELMKKKPRPQCYDGMRPGWRRELDIRKQVNCIEIVKDE